MSENLFDGYLGSNEKALALIKQVPHLKEMHSDDLKLVLEHAKLVRYDPDEIIINEDEFDVRIYFLLSGAVTILKDNREMATIDNPGDFFGEMAILEASSRCAKVVAKVKSTLLSIDASIMDRFDENYMAAASMHFFKMFALKLSERLKKALEENSQLKKRIEGVEKGSKV